jgi:hypothetical protein
MSANIVKRLANVFDIVEHWDFLKEAMEGLNKKARATYEPESFFYMLSKVASKGTDGLVVVLTSKNDKPLGFGCAFVATDFHGDDCFYVWAAFSTGKCRTTLTELQQACEDYARAIGQRVVKTATPRINHGADRLFCDILGYRREFTTYRKDI